MTKADLISKHWWWRRTAFADYDEQTHTTKERKALPERFRLGEIAYGAFRYWKSKREITAWRYEIARRACSVGEYPPYPELPSMLEAAFIRQTGRATPPLPCHVAGLPWLLKRENDWTNPDVQMQWNLKADDNALIRSFMAYINRERAAKKLPTTQTALRGKTNKRKSSNRGNNNKSPSWLWVELLDESSYKLRYIDYTGTLSKARKASADCAEKFLATWRALEQMPDCARADYLAEAPENPAAAERLSNLLDIEDEFLCRIMPILGEGPNLIRLKR